MAVKGTPTSHTVGAGGAVQRLRGRDCERIADRNSHGLRLTSRIRSHLRRHDEVVCPRSRRRARMRPVDPSIARPGGSVPELIENCLGSDTVAVIWSE